MRKVLTIASMGILSASLAYGSGLGLYGAYWSPNDADAGYGAGAKLLLGSGPVALELRGTYFQDLSDDIDLGAAGEIDIDLEVVPLEVGLVISIPTDAPIEPYLGAGVGYYMMEVNAENAFGDKATFDIDDEVGWYGMAGLKFVLSDSASLFAEALYRDVEGTAAGDDIDDIEEEVTLDLAGLGVNAGVLFLW